MDNALASLKNNITKVILGKEEPVRLTLLGLLAGGHILIEDIPGVGKTTMAQALARSLNSRFKRIQFTPDLLPSDITGVAVYDMDAKEFVFKPGPIFANIILADEINRTTPRTQSALLEAMSHNTVTVDSITHELPRPFMVLATQNPLEFTGAYPLPESQLDRFLLKIELDYPAMEDEKAILMSRRLSDPLKEIAPVLSSENVCELMERVKQVKVEETVLNYLTRIIEKTRNHSGLVLGASPRASLGLFRIAQAAALLDNRDYVMPDDIKDLAVHVLAHRVLTHERIRSKAASEAAANIIREIVDTTAVPV